MSKKTFLAIRIATAMILAMVISISYASGNYILALVAFVTALGIILVSRAKVKGVLADERDYKIAGQSAKATMNIFNITMVILGAAMMALSKTHPDFALPAQIIVYSVCAQMILYSILFKIYSRYGDDEK